MSFKRVTLKDISQKVGLAVPVISRILNNKATYCSDQKIQEVKAAAAALGYRRNPGYSIMTGEDTNIVAIIFSQQRITHNPHINQLYMNLCTKLRERNYSSYCAVLDIQNSVQEQLAQLQELDDLGCRSYIFIGHPTGFDQLQEFLKKCNRNFITMNNFHSPRNVSLDNAGMFVEFVNDFRKRGLTSFRIVTTEAFFNEVILPQIPEKDKDFFRQTLFPRPVFPVISEEPDTELFKIGYMTAGKLLQNVPDIQAAVFSSDYLAFGAAKFFADHHKSEVEVCGMNKSIAANYAFCPLGTTIFDMDECAEKLLDNLHGDEPVNILIPGKIIHCDIQNQPFDNNY